MSIAPFPIQCKRDNKWETVQTDELLPGDLVSIGTCFNSALIFRNLLKDHIVRQQSETTVPADILLVAGTCIVNEAMLSGESTPLLKESIELLDGSEKLDADGTHKNAMLYSGTKVLQARSGGM
jgi:manganese-transporting P-type ATPase